MSVGPPFILDQRPDAGGGILVTWSLPGLVRAAVRVPSDVWLAGDHTYIAASLVNVTQPPVMVADDAEYPEDYPEDEGSTY